MFPVSLAHEIELGLGFTDVLALDIVLVVHLLGLLLSMTLGLLLIEPVFAFAFGQFVYLSTGKACNELLGEGVGYWLACGGVSHVLGMLWGRRRTLRALVILKSLETSKGSTSSNNLVSKAGLVLLEVVVVVDLLVAVLAVVCGSAVSNTNGKPRSKSGMERSIPQKPILRV